MPRNAALPCLSRCCHISTTYCDVARRDYLSATLPVPLIVPRNAALPLFVTMRLHTTTSRVSTTVTVACPGVSYLSAATLPVSRNVLRDTALTLFVTKQLSTATCRGVTTVTVTWRSVTYLGSRDWLRPREYRLLLRREGGHRSDVRRDSWEHEQPGRIGRVGMTGRTKTSNRCIQVATGPTSA